MGWNDGIRHNILKDLMSTQHRRNWPKEGEAFAQQWEIRKKERKRERHLFTFTKKTEIHRKTT